MHLDPLVQAALVSGVAAIVVAIIRLFDRND